MNEIEIEEAWRILGELGRGQIQRLSNFLELELPKDARFAPSIIVRSEAQLFGISMPRFALRLLLPGNAGLVNCRRIDDFIDAAEGDGFVVWGNRLSHSGSSKNDSITRELGSKPLGEILLQENQSCIADCLLALPSSYSTRDCTLLTVDLQLAYGEIYAPSQRAAVGETKPTQCYSPYVKTIDLGGGLCAQSVCYMATAFLDYANAIYGLSEITALAHNDDCQELRISGLTLDEICRYFSRIGLNGIQQLPVSSTFGFKRSDADVQKEFEIAIESYIRSGFPVLLPTDMGLLAAQVYPQNGITDSAASEQEHKHHAIILVGFYSDPLNSTFRVIFHDPAYFPFMNASAGELAEAGFYSRDEGDPEKRLIISVTPAKVKLPLLWWRRGQAEPCERGLIWLSRDMRGIPKKMQFPPGYGRFLLLRVDQFSDEMCLSFLGPKANTFAHRVQGLKAGISSRFGWDRSHWVWLEDIEDMIIIWDAEAEPQAADGTVYRSSFNKYFKATLVTDPEFRIIWAQTDPHERT